MIEAWWHGHDRAGDRRSTGDRAKTLRVFEGATGLAALGDVVTPEVRDPHTFRMVIRSAAVAGVAIHSVDATPYRLTRTPSRITAVPWPSLLLVHPVRGMLHLRQDGKDYRASTGDFLLLRTNEEFTLGTSERSVGELLTVPLRRLHEEGDLLQAHPFGMMSATCPIASMMLSVIRTASRGSVPSPGSRAAQMLEDAVTSLLRSALAGAREGRTDPADDRSVLRIQVEDHVRKNFADPRMGPEHVSHQFGISTRTLRRLFEGHPSVSEVVRSHRTEAMIRLLTSTPAQFDEIARQIGFGSSASARRALAERTGMTPEQLRPPGRRVKSLSGARESDTG